MTDVFERLTAALADRYAIEHELGAGGMATVYLAEDLKHHRKVAATHGRETPKEPPPGRETVCDD